MDPGVCDATASTCRYANTCKELLAGNPKLALKNGVYVLDFDGLGPKPYYCDMTIDGGGWTALINPVIAEPDGGAPPLPATVSTLTQATTTVVGGQCGSTANNNSGPKPNGWNAVERDGCGGFSLTLTWVNKFNATDLMFNAVLQATTGYSLTVNTVPVTYDIQTVENGTPACFFWDGDPTPTSPGPSGCAGATWCAQTYLNPLPPPHEYAGMLKDVTLLTMVLDTGPNDDLPDGCYNKGMNVQQLFVR
jgi:hypothetical protein